MNFHLSTDLFCFLRKKPQNWPLTSVPSNPHLPPLFLPLPFPLTGVPPRPNDYFPPLHYSRRRRILPRTFQRTIHYLKNHWCRGGHCNNQQWTLDVLFKEDNICPVILIFFTNLTYR